MAKRLVIFAALLVSLAVAALLIVSRPHRTRPRVDCGPLLQTSMGAYSQLARVDADGYVLPLAGLKLDETSRWELELVDVRLGNLRVVDRGLIARWQKMRFGCTGTDTGTPETEARVYRDGALVYATSLEWGDGLQNQELGFIEPDSKAAFWWMFLFSPGRWRASTVVGTSTR